MIKRSRFVFFIIVSLPVFLSILFFLVFKGIIRFNHPSLTEFPLRGIDISHHQGLINWEKLKQENVKFIFIKATEGGDFIDNRFQQNTDSALAWGYKVGAYHFYRLCRDGKTQARHFIATTRNFPFTMPPAVDIEFGGNCKAIQNTDETIRQIKVFLDTVESVYGTPPVIYATQESYNTLIAGNFSKNPIWIRDIFTRPKLKDKRVWKFWQFANRGKLRGIKSYVDINVFNGADLNF